MHYITIDDAVQKIVRLGQGLLPAKSTLRVPSGYFPSIWLIVTCWQYVGNNECTLTPAYHWAQVSPKTNVLADLLSWIILKQGASYLIHYLDDF